MLPSERFVRKIQRPIVEPPNKTNHAVQENVITNIRNSLRLLTRVTLCGFFLPGCGVCSDGGPPE